MGLAETWITIRPDTTGFRTETDAELRKALADAGVQIKVGADTASADRAADALKIKLADLSKRITANIDVADKPAQAKLLALQSQLIDIGKKVVSPKIDLAGVVSAQSSLAALDVVLDEIDKKHAEPSVKVQTDTARLDALRTKLDEVAARATSASVDVDDKTATAKLLSLRAKLDDLGQKTATPNIDINGIAHAEADLAALDAQLDTIGRKDETAKVKADTSQASQGVNAFVSSLIALAPVAIPVSAALVGGTAGLLGGIASAGVGIGGIAAVAVPAIDKVKAALQAQQTAQQSVTGTTASSAASQVSSANQITSAQLSLQNARRNAANQAITSAEQVKNAQQTLTDARRTQANDQITSAEAVKNAQQSLSDAERTQANDRITSAQSVASAEQALDQAQQQELLSQQALTQARVAAKQALQDLSNNLVDAKLSAQQDALNIETAQKTLQTTLANPASTTQQREQAQLDYEKAVQALKEQQIQVQRLTAQQQVATKQGVDGSTQVQQADRNLAQAKQSVADKQQALADAQRQANQTAQRDAEAVARAQQSVSDAQRQAALTQQKDAEAVAKAQQGIADAVRAQTNQQAQSAAAIESAQLSLQNAYDSAAKAATGSGTAASTAAAKAQKALAGLSPAQTDLLNGWDAFKKDFADFASTYEPAALAPIIGALPLALEGFGKIAPAIVPASKAITGLETDAKKALGDPFWTQFFGYIDSQAGPSISSFGHDIGNVAKGFAGLIQAFGPVEKQFEGGLENLTKKFATFGASANSSSGFNSFMVYIETEGPQVIHLIGQLAGIIGQLAKDAAPVGAIELQIVNGLLQFVDAEVKAHPKLVEMGVAIASISKAIQLLKLGSLISTVDKIAGIGGKGISGVAGTLENIGTKGAEAAGGAGMLSKAGDAITKKFPGVTKLLSGTAGVLGGLGGLFGATGLAATGVGAAAIVAAGGLAYLGDKIATAKSGNEAYYDSLVKQYHAQGNNVQGYQNLQKAVDKAKDSSGKLLYQYALQQQQQQNLQSSTGSLAGQTDQTTTSQEKFSLQIAKTKQDLEEQNYALKQNQDKLEAVNKGADYIKTAFQNAGGQMQLTTKQALQLADSLGIHNVAGAFDGSSRAAQNNRQKLEDYIQEVKLSHNPQQQLKDDIAQAGNSAATADQQVQGLSGALDILAGKNISAASADLNFRSQVDSLSGTLKQNHEQLGLNTAAGVSNRQAIANAGQAAIDAANAYQRQGHNAKDTSKYLEGLEYQLEQTLIKQTGNKKGVDDLLHSLGLLPSQAQSAFGSLNSNVHQAGIHLNNLTKHPYTISVDANGIWQYNSSTGVLQNSKDYGTLGRNAAGGLITGPGGPRDDKVLMWGSNGEYMQPAHVVAREGVGAMDALRAGKATITPRFAAGGYIHVTEHDNLGKLAGSENSWIKSVAKSFAQSLGVSGGAIIAEAMKFLGTPYVWGGNQPGGFDCSGLVQYVLGQLGISAPRTAAQQQAWATPITKSQAMAGDEVFWGDPAHHTAFYLGNNKMLEAPETGDVVKIANLYGSPTFGRERDLGNRAGTLLGGPVNSNQGSSPFSGGSAGANQRIAYGLLPSFGWSQDQMGPLVKLWNKESGWNQYAQNPTSTAYGIPQFLNSTWGSYKYPKTSNPYQQEYDGLSYIGAEYGSPAAAWAHEQYFNWYGNGLKGGIFTRPTLIGVGDKQPERVDVTPIGAGSGAGGFDYDRLGAALAKALGVRTAPLIGHADFHDNTDVALTLNRAAFVASSLGLTS